MSFRLALAALLVASLAASPATARAGPPVLEPLRPADVFELEWATDPQISPDGEQVVYVRNWMDVKRDRRRSNLWLIDVDSGTQRPLTTGSTGDRMPRWSPDGSRLAWIGDDEDDSPQIFVRWLESGAIARVANLTREPKGLEWSPGGEMLAFTMPVVNDADPLEVDMPEEPDGARWAKKPEVIDRLIYRVDGEGYVEDAYDHVFVVSAEGGTPRQLTSGPYQHDVPLAWMPGGEALVVSAYREPGWQREPLDSELYLIPLAGGRLEALTDRFGPDRSPAVSPDGRRLAWLGFDDRRQGYQVTELHVMELAGRERRSLTPELDRDAAWPQWTADGRALVFTYDDRGDTRLARVGLDGEIEVWQDDVGGTALGRPYAGGSFSLAGSERYAYTQNRKDRPADVAVGRGDRPARRLTALNEDVLEHRNLGTVEEIWYTSSYDERPVQGWVIKPPGFDPDREYPLLLEIHGGPFLNYGPRFSAELQLYAADGYVVLYTNPRGSTGYGEAFGNLIHHAYPGDDYFDLMSGVDAVVSQGYVDQERLYITGGSGGGVLTAWTIGRTDRFRAAVVVKPAINWTSFVLTADMNTFFYRYWFPGFPWEHPEVYWERSPLSLVGEVETPTMVMTGEVDWRTPIWESEQYYQALKLRGIDTVLVRIPRASHSIARRPSQLIAKVQYTLAWFERHGGSGDD